MAEVVLDVWTKSQFYSARCSEQIGTTSVVIRKNWNDTEKISIAPGMSKPVQANGHD